MDQQQEPKKNKRPYYNNRRRNNNRSTPKEGGKPAAAQEIVQTGEDHVAATNNFQSNSRRPEGKQNAKTTGGNGHTHSNGNGTGGEIHTRRGSFRPAPDAVGARENEIPTQKKLREPREGRENINKPRGERNGRNRDNGRENGRNRDGAPREPRSDDHTFTGRTDSDVRPRRNNEKNRRRGNDSKITSGDITSYRDNLSMPRDPEMDSWFTLSPSNESRFENPQQADRTPSEFEPEMTVGIHWDLSDILPPIVMEKYETPTPPPAENDAETVSEVSEEAPPIADVEVVGVRFSKTGKVYYFAPNGNSIRKGDAVIVETARGLEFGEAWQENHTVPETEIVPPLRPVVRLADSKDIAHNAENRRREEEAFHICLEKIKTHELDMKLVEAQYTFDNTKLLFYFTSAGRVDFRELVKDLASVFRTRIELRQIGIRDEAKLMGGLGICGRPLCCASFLSDFSQVSIKMAKEQNLSLNSAKISGTCGRLMCCLNYEYATYCEAARRTPSVGTVVSTPDGSGTVIETNPLAGTVKVALTNASHDTVPQMYRREDVCIQGENGRHADETEEPENQIEYKEN